MKASKESGRRRTDDVMEKEAEGSYNILQGLPNHVLAYVLFFLDKDSKHVSVLNVLSKSFVVGDPVWNALFHIRFGNDMMKWPVFTSWKGYYNFLHKSLANTEGLEIDFPVGTFDDFKLNSKIIRETVPVIKSNSNNLDGLVSAISNKLKAIPMEQN